MDTRTRQRRAEVLRQMGEVEIMERGKVCEMRRGPTGPGQRVYFNHQFWHRGKNHSSYVAGERVEALQAAIEGREHFEQLAGEFVDLSVAATRLGAAQESKKNSRKKSAGRGSRKPKAS
jgi:hypothetical protein